MSAVNASQIERMITKGSVGHSWLCVGDSEHFAFEMARQLLGIETFTLHHPDVHQFRAEGKVAMHSIESMRRLNKEVYMAPHQSEWKVFFVFDADRMLPTSSNALLKTFEEPPENTLIILFAQSVGAILPTIRSRCRTLFFPPKEKEPYRCEILYQTLSEGGFRGYRQVQDCVKEIVCDIDGKKSRWMDEVHESIFSVYPQDITATQRVALEKEVEGVVSLRYQAEVDQFLQGFLGWYRDIELLSVGGDESFLCHPEYKEALSKGTVRAVDQVHKIVSDAQLSIARSSGLSAVLETLFLKIDNIK